MPSALHAFSHLVLTRTLSGGEYFYPFFFFFFFDRSQVACRIVVLQLGIEPKPPALEAQSPNH